MGRPKGKYKRPRGANGSFAKAPSHPADPAVGNDSPVSSDHEGAEISPMHTNNHDEDWRDEDESQAKLPFGPAFHSAASAVVSAAARTAMDVALEIAPPVQKKAVQPLHRSTQHRHKQASRRQEEAGMAGLFAAWLKPPAQQQEGQHGSPQSMETAGAVEMDVEMGEGDADSSSSEHGAEEGTVNMCSDRCKQEGCTTQPSYGVPGSKELEFCGHHAKEGMVNLNGKRPLLCVARSKKPEFCSRQEEHDRNSSDYSSDGSSDTDMLVCSGVGVPLQDWFGEDDQDLAAELLCDSGDEDGFLDARDDASSRSDRSFGPGESDGERGDEADDHVQPQDTGEAAAVGGVRHAASSGTSGEAVRRTSRTNLFDGPYVDPARARDRARGRRGGPGRSTRPRGEAKERLAGLKSKHTKRRRGEERKKTPEQRAQEQGARERARERALEAKRRRENTPREKELLDIYRKVVDVMDKVNKYAMCFRVLRCNVAAG